MQLSTFKINRYFAKHEFASKYTVCNSDCESFTIQDLLALDPESHDLFHRHWLGYTNTQGAPALRREICRLYTSIQHNDVLVHSGAEEAIFLFMHATLQAGDHIIVHSPYFQSLAEVARSIGCEITRWEADERNGWALDLDDLKRNIRSNTKSIVVNIPHNPTGFLMSHQDFLELNSIAREKGLIVFSDEVFRECEYDVADRLPAACDINNQAISLGVMSKTYGLPGLRIGWIATHNAEIYAKMAALKDYTTICNSAPAEFLAELALRHRQKLIRRNLDIIARNLNLLDAFFSRFNEQFTWVRPSAGPIAFPRLLGEDVESFCQDLVATANILLLPGTVFDDSENHFRIGFGRASLPEVLAQFEAFLQSRHK